MYKLVQSHCLISGKENGRIPQNNRVPNLSIQFP